MIAVAGWDADGNGVLLLSEFSAGKEPRRVGYHVLCKSAFRDETEEARRRRRLRGWTPEIPQTPEGGRLYVGERLEVLEKGMEQIRFDEEDEFVSVTRVQSEVEENNGQDGDRHPDDGALSQPLPEGANQASHCVTADDPTGNSHNNGIGSDSVTTETLDDESNLPSLGGVNQ